MNARKTLARWSTTADRTSKNGIIVLVVMLIGFIGTIVTLVQSLGDGDEIHSAVVTTTAPSSTVGATASEARSAPDLLQIKTTTDDEVTTFVLPIDAPLDDFPYEVTANCSPAQRDWLRAHGQERQTTYWSELRNADTGSKSQLALSNMRLEGEFLQAPADPVILFTCPAAGQVDLVELDQPLVEGEQARDVKTGAPLGFNLAPGEAGQLLVHLTGGAGFEGLVQMNVSSGTETVSQSLTRSKIVMPALGPWGAMTVSVGSEAGSFFCEANDEDYFDSCDPSEIPELVRQFETTATG